MSFQLNLLIHINYIPFLTIQSKQRCSRQAVKQPIKDTKINTIAEIKNFVTYQKKLDKKIAFVPTMGSLHDGHLSLVEIAKQHADIVICSIFINAKQFAANEDLAKYPKNLEDDISKLTSRNIDCLYMPEHQEIYPDNILTEIKLKKINNCLCGRSRPEFLGGVALVVLKLFNQIMPDIAIFGEKDYQQLLMIKQLVRDLDIPIDIISGEIIRETDGLAMSSRNIYLSEQERKVAPKLFYTLQKIARIIKTSQNNNNHNIDSSINIAAILDEAKNDLLDFGFTKVDYLEIRRESSLALLSESDLNLITKQNNARIFAAIYMNDCRLIDNIAIL
ncbi:MAG: pantoate--beta-alanine ligase [Pseudomonadota bacterium]